MFGKGKIDIAIQKTSYAPGDVISGTVALTLKRPVKARELSISLIGEYRTTQTIPRVGTLRVGGTIARGRLSWMERGMLMSAPTAKAMRTHDFKTIKKTVRIYGFKQQLHGEGEYRQGRQYHFDIRIRTDIPTSPKWYLLAKLDIPSGLDVSKKIRITIG
jgi:hypothetical protein